MIARSRALALVLTCVAMLVVVGLASALDVGQKAPDFTLPSTTGKDVSLKDFLGKKVVLIEFYGQDFSPV